MNCNICAGVMKPFGDAVLLGKYSVEYFQCSTCGYTRTATPYWLSEAYAEAINDSDVGLVNRNIFLSRVTKAVIFACFRRDWVFLDYGAGYGLFVRLMRDLGLNFLWYDKFSANLFAKMAVADMAGATRYELLTAFEVFEHLPDPVDELEQMLKLSNSILFTTLLIPSNNPRPGNWWYYGLDHGQHVSLYTYRSLERLADKFGLRIYSDGRFIHLLTTKRIVPRLFKLLVNYRIASLVNVIIKRPSLIEADYQQITGLPLK